MTIFDICQEAVSTRFISAQLAHQLNHVLWTRNLNAVEMATLNFVYRGIESGYITVSHQPLRYSRKVLQAVD
ncbi:MAG: hypothetical protein HC799_06085 [Limnothrix sp. RL_2_0]|nr:hypothetical protein [Limnothrix sp. RL_2_0]